MKVRVEEAKKAECEKKCFPLCSVCGGRLCVSVRVKATQSLMKKSLSFQYVEE